MTTERPCWGPAGSGSKCHPAICSNRLNSRPSLRFEQTSHPRRRMERLPCGVDTGLAPRGTASPLLPGPGCVPGVAGSVSSSPQGRLPPPGGSWGARRRCGCVRMLTVGVSAARSPTCIPQQSHVPPLGAARGTRGF